MSSNHYEPAVSSWNALNNFFIYCYLLCQNIWTLITGKSHLERILERQHSHRAQIISHVEWYLIKTGCIVISSLSKTDAEDLFKRFNVTAQGEQRVMLKYRLDRYMNEMVGYGKLYEAIDERRKEKFNPSNPDHVEKLKKLWILTMPDKESEFALVSKEWQEIGFQGNDPSTDFRGMGLLSLDQLIFLCEKFPDKMKYILKLSLDPKIGFPMAVAGITITSFTHHMLKKGGLRKHFYNVSAEHKVDMIEYNKAYCRIFELFCDYWKKHEPATIMLFNDYRLNFEKAIYNQLERDNADLNIITVCDL